MAEPRTGGGGRWERLQETLKSLALSFAAPSHRPPSLQPLLQPLLGAHGAGLQGAPSRRGGDCSDPGCGLLRAALCLLTRFRPSEMLMVASISSSLCEAQGLSVQERHTLETEARGTLPAPLREAGAGLGAPKLPLAILSFRALHTGSPNPEGLPRSQQKTSPARAPRRSAGSQGRRSARSQEEGFIPSSLSFHSTGLPQASP